ncbi:MAG: hypothetical protein EXR73_01020 [Myxococcales bacterium]|nr:hypothetical protein [Myxococcales bacterium]
MFRPRDLSDAIERACRSFPCVLVTGPRQSGKSTLLRQRFGGSHAYVSLDQPDARERARRDPSGFFRRHPAPLILDEVQHVPELLSYVKAMVDENRRPGQFLLSGSQSFALMQGIKESLAGRVAVLTLLPLSAGEIAGRVRDARDREPIPARWIAGQGELPKRIALARWLMRGGYPERWFARGVDQELWAASYVQTYLERDVRSLIGVRDLNAFATFLRLVAARTGQILNLSDLARDAGITHPTARPPMDLGPRGEPPGPATAPPLRQPRQAADQGAEDLLARHRHRRPSGRPRRAHRDHPRDGRRAVRDRRRRRDPEGAPPSRPRAAPLVLPLARRLGGRRSDGARRQVARDRDQAHRDAAPTPRRAARTLPPRDQDHGRPRLRDLRRPPTRAARARRHGDAVGSAVAPTAPASSRRGTGGSRGAGCG